MLLHYRALQQRECEYANEQCDGHGSAARSGGQYAVVAARGHEEAERECKDGERLKEHENREARAYVRVREGFKVL